MRAAWVVACVAALVVAKTTISAEATDLITKAPPASVIDLSGFYVGGHVGYAGGSSGWTATDPAGGGLSGTLDLYNGFDIFKGTGSFFAGFQGGYNVVLPSRIFVGFEADTSFPNTLAGTVTATSAFAGMATFSDMVLHSGTVRGRIGYAFDHWLLYATSGFAWSYDQLTRTQVAGGIAGPGTCGGSVGPQAPASSCQSRRAGPRGLNICSAISDAAA